MKQIGIFIPGRLKSERLPNKLILPLGQSCLWDIACDKLNKLPSKYNKYVLCYDEQLVDIASRYENLKVIIRDKSTTEVDGPLTHIFKDMQPVEDSHLMFLNPCLSLLSLDTITKSLFDFEQSDFEYATSVKQYKNWIWNDKNQNITPIDYQSLSTKTIPVHYEAAHCFHIFNKKYFFNTGKMLDDNLQLIEVPKQELVDVDDYTDYKFACHLHNCE